jgi:threonine/homoserine/homoserine lactone efflux protein
MPTANAFTVHASVQWPWMIFCQTPAVALVWIYAQGLRIVNMHPEFVVNLWPFLVATLLLTITPGIDTALVLRTSAVEGPRQGMLAGAGIAAGSVVWGIITALGLSALLAVSATAYLVVQLAGAGYLIYLGVGMIRNAFAGPEPNAAGEPAELPIRSSRTWFLRGLLTNLLNPKVGVFYVSFLPQFIPAGDHVAPLIVFLAVIHAALGLCWFGALTLATQRLSGVLRRPDVVRGLEGATGALMVLFGLRMALDRPS